MIKRYNRISLLFGASGLALCLVGPLAGKLLAYEFENNALLLVGLVVACSGMALLLLGLVYYAKSKGQAEKWAWSGLITPWILYFLPDKTAIKRRDDSVRSKNSSTSGKGEDGRGERGQGDGST